ncbi:hypothetical protein [Klebsiella sp. S69]|uniref:hypothetical protein n=1 Tax=Klebsiella sp. S69 TaxID=2767439 RepID=UPI001907A348|nr:hypothetical protein [Klebsiella sp. S69]MBK0167488.1 hypothetical protein [Klebsiella sp. S69]
MKIYWTLKSIPELSQLPLKERGKRWRCAYWRTFRHWETWGALVLMALFTGSGSYFFSGFGSAVMAGTGGFIYSQIVIYVARKYYLHYLKSEPYRS